MKKTMLIEMLFYAVLTVVGIILLFVYKPEKQEIVIPEDFEIQWNGGDR